MENLALGQYFSELDGIENALRTAFGKQMSEGSIDLAGKVREDLEEIGRRGSDRRTMVAVVGSKNAGKSWLCRLLVQDDAARSEIGSGSLSKDGTREVTWIGDDLPSDLPGRRIRVRGGQMLDCGQPYYLADTPGYDDGSEVNRESIDWVVGAPVRVVIVTPESREVERLGDFLRITDGVPILPVCRDDDGSLEAAGENDLRDLRERLVRACPKAKVLEPVVVQKCDGAPDKSARDDQARGKVQEAIRMALGHVDPKTALERRMFRFRSELGVSLTEPLAKVRPHFERLLETERDAVRKVVGELLGTDSQLRAGLRIRMRMGLVGGTPACFFPYRSLLGILALTSGAWDKLVFALVGSVPSLAMTVLQTARNATRLGEAKEFARKAMTGRAERLLQGHLKAAQEIFGRAVRENLRGGGEDARDTQEAAVSLDGLETLEAESARVFEDAVEKHRMANGALFGIGAFATALFAVLAAGPLGAIYREFFRVWLKAVDLGQDVVRWSDFPVPSASMLIGTFILLVVPVAVLALMTVGMGVTGRQVDRAVEYVRSEHERLAAGKVSGSILRVVSQDPVREAVRFLLERFRKGE